MTAPASSAGPTVTQPSDSHPLDVAALIAEADASQAAGRSLEALRRLSEANARRRDTRLERRLLRLRHEAFQDLDRSPGTSGQTSDRAMPHLDPVHAPPLRAAQLTPEIIRTGIVRHGYVHARGVVRPDRIKTLVAGIDRAFAAAEALEAGADPAETTPWFERFVPDEAYGKSARIQVGNRRKWVREAAGVFGADSPRMLFELFDTFESVGLAELVAGVLGERPALAFDKCTLRRVGRETKSNWHQDGAFLGHGDLRTLNVWMSLSHCGRDAPGLDLVPRRIDHIVETGTEGALFGWAVGQGVVDRYAQTAPVVRPIIEPGDVIFFDELNLHRTAIDPSMTEERYAIETWFFAPSLYPEKYVPFVA